MKSHRPERCHTTMARWFLQEQASDEDLEVGRIRTASNRLWPRKS